MKYEPFSTLQPSNSHAKSKVKTLYLNLLAYIHFTSNSQTYILISHVSFLELRKIEPYGMNSAETERLFARNFARLARKFDRSTKLELEIARKNLARKRLELDIARKRFCSNLLARNMPCSFMLGFAR